MPLQATSGAASYDAFGGGAAAVPQYIEDVFSTYLYTGTGNSVTQRIASGIDLAAKGGMVWVKNRTQVTDHQIYDTARGERKYIRPNTTDAEFDSGANQVQYKTSGWDAFEYTNELNKVMASWTFREQPKFFDIVTFSGNDTTKTLSHNLGSVPGSIIVKSLLANGNWRVWHRGLTSGNYAVLNSTAAQTTTGAATVFGNNSTTVDPTSTQFTVGSTICADGENYVAYLFAHDAGGFGLTGTDNVISCGSFTTDAFKTGYATLPFSEAQWILVKCASNAGSWFIVDNMRGIYTNFADANGLSANTSAAETTRNIDYGNSSSNYQFRIFGGDGVANSDYIYIAIRRGPMKVPTSGTSVFLPQTRTGTGSGTVVVSNIGFTPDLAIIQDRSSNQGVFEDRLRGNFALFSLQTNAESNTGVEGASGQQGWAFNASTGYGNNSVDYVNYFLQRAPGYFDEVCYTGNSATPRTITHNLGVAPELMIIKSRSNTRGWAVYASAIGNNKYLILNGTNAALTDTTIWVNTAPTSSVFTVGDPFDVNNTGYTYVAYLFATLAGISKVGSYTGNGTTQTINCGFTGGARLVLIKRTNAAGDWYVYDTARGMTVLTDPYLILNDSVAETATLGSVTTVSTGFALNSTILAAINVNGGTYIFLALA
jgi:hypothetical protein